MRTLLLVAFALISVGCGRARVLQVDPAFAPYVARFESDANAAGLHIKIDDLIVTFGELPSSGNTVILGRCYRSESTPRIVINSAISFDSWSDLERESLLYHELGHCVLNKEHDSTLNGVVPNSVMYPDHGPVWQWYGYYRDAMVAALFK